MKFSKAEGLGNDFLIISQTMQPDVDWPALAIRICNRHTGIGADGHLVYQDSPQRSPGFFTMRVFNADGSEAEMSGNGIRCLAAYLCSEPRFGGDRICIETVSGDHWLQRLEAAHPWYWFLVDMGQPLPPTLPPGMTGTQGPEGMGQLIIPLAAGSVPATITSMGNPHCTIFVNEFERTNWQEMGRHIESHSYFPKRTNVEFVRVVDRKRIEVRFWERGVGKTFSSGTGASAAVVASVARGFTEREVEVETLGGRLQIHWKEDNRVYLKGPARLIGEGEFYSDSGGEAQGFRSI
ncbi:MAG: diaminopimelate epimerase [Terriglobia bacterium]